MPIVPAQLGAPYDVVNDILNTARVRANDAIASLGGDVLTNIQPFTQTYFNDAWRDMQRGLANKGYARLNNEIVLYGLPVCSSTDPASQVWLDWSQYFDGQFTFTPPNCPVLPQFMKFPLRLYERWSGTQNRFVEMEMMLDGIPNQPKWLYNGVWEWRSNAIYMPGCQRVTDLRIKFAQLLPDFVDYGGAPWYSQQIPIVDCKSCLANHLCYQFCKARGDSEAPTFMAEAQADEDKIINDDIRAKQRVNARRRARSGYGGQRGANTAYGW